MTELPIYHLGILRGYLSGQNAPTQVLLAAETLYLAAVQGPLRTDALEAIRLISDAAEKLTAQCNRPVVVGPDKIDLPAIPEPEVPGGPIPVQPAAEEPPPTPSTSEILVQIETSLPQAQSKETTTDPRGWTPERRAAQAERAKDRRKRPFDEDFEAVKADFDAGMSPAAIGRKWGCSDTHIRNFFMNHGVDPRRGRRRDRDGGQSEPSVEQHEAPRAAVSEFSEEPAVTESPQPHRLMLAHPGYAGRRKDGQLVESDWPDIREMLAQGRTHSAIAGDFDVEVEELDFFIASQRRREGKEASRPSGEAPAPLRT